MRYSKSYCLEPDGYISEAPIGFWTQGVVACSSDISPFYLPYKKLFFHQASNISSCWLQFFASQRIDDEINIFVFIGTGIFFGKDPKLLSKIQVLKLLRIHISFCWWQDFLRTFRETLTFFISHALNFLMYLQ